MFEKTALVSGNVRLTYREVDDWANCDRLLEAGVCRGDRVAIWLDNGPDAAAAIFGVLKASAVFVPINPSTKLEKLSYIVADCGAKALVASALRSCTVSLPGCAKVDPADTTSRSPDAPPKQRIDIDLAAIIILPALRAGPRASC